MHTRNRLWLALFGAALLAGIPASQAANVSQAAAPRPLVTAPAVPQITASVTNGKSIALSGTVTSAAMPKFDKGLVAGNLQLNHLTLMLKRSPDREARAQAYAKQLTSPRSAYFHKWLTPQQIGDMFGPSKQDIAKVTQWLNAQGLRTDGVDATGMRISFSGNATTVQRAFKTELHNYVVNGKQHFANATPQYIPAALSPVVAGVASLSSLKPKSLVREVGPVTKTPTGPWQAVGGKTSPAFTNSTSEYDVAPADFNKIYNVDPLWTQGMYDPQNTPVRGAGQTIAVLERTNILPADVDTFRAAFGPADAAGVVTYEQPTGPATCANPGTNGDEIEAALDAEWAGAAAPDANVLVASCADTSTDFGPFIAAENILANNVHNVAIMSLSYGGCEAQQGTAGLYEVNSLWQQAAMQGVTVFVSTGDSGAAGCDQNEELTTLGTAVNGLASTPYNVAVGGTDFFDLGTSGNSSGFANYWNPTNAPNGSSAKGYIPEQTWNNSCASSVISAFEGAQGFPGAQDGESFCNTARGQLFLQYNGTGGGSGGISSYIAKPTWQYGVYGTKNDSARTLPDISMFAANGFFGHSLIFCMSDPEQGGTPCDYTVAGNVRANSAGGTSFAAPALAGVQALVNSAVAIAGHFAGSPDFEGNVLPAYYNIATREYGSQLSPNTAGLAACNSASTGLAGNGCAFNNVTTGDISEPCLPLSVDCFSRPGHQTGVLSTAGRAQLAPAYMAGAGYNYATGLGSVNAAVLTDAYVEQLFTSNFGQGVVSDFLGGASADAPDGTSDIVYINPANNTLTELGMTGATVLQTQTQPVAAGYTIGAIADLGMNFDTHGQLASFAFTNPATRQLYVWMNDGNGGRTAYRVGSPYPAGWVLVGSGNMDGSGNALVWRNDSTGQVGWWDLTFTAGSTTVGVTYSNLLPAASGYKLTLADLNGDGVMDFVFTGPNNDLYTWINDGSGNFAHHFITNFPAGWVLQGAGDVNGDGVSDLLFTNATANQFGWWIMDSDGVTVTDRKTLSVGAGYQIATIGDFNGDGLVDVLWTDAAGHAYDWQSTGADFQGFRLSDTTGAAVTLPAGAQVQANRFQGQPYSFY